MNKLTLIGENQENGYGIVIEKGNVISLLKQPFVMDNRFILNEEELGNAYSHGFAKVNKEFDNFSALEKHLNNLVKEFKDRNGIKDRPFSKDGLADYYRTLPTSVIETTIEILEEEPDDIKFILFVDQALRENPRFEKIGRSHKSILLQLSKSAKAKEKERLAPFHNLDLREYAKHKDYSPLYKMAS